MRALVAVLLLASSLPALAHDMYQGWRQPGTGQSCCNNRDCYPTNAQFRRGEWYALRREDKQWVRVPANKIISDVSPDGKAHLCSYAPTPAFPNPAPLCFVPPEGGV